MKQGILLIIFLTAIIFNGCDSKNETKEEKTNSGSENKKNINEKETENKISELKSNEETNTDTTLTEGNKSNQLEMEPGLPADFPKDVPQPVNAKLLGSLNSSDGMMVTYESSEKVQDIINQYKENMKTGGYIIDEGGEIITPDKGGLINWTKQGKSVQLVLGFDKDKGLTSFVITYK